MADADDVQAQEITPEDFDGKQETPKADPSPAKEEAKAEAKPEAKAEPAKEEPKTPEGTEENLAVPADEEGKEGDSADKPTEEDKPKRGAEPRKEELNTEIRDLVARRNALRESVARTNSEAYQPATEKELVDEGMSATDAKVEALRQTIEVKDYNDKVADAQLTIESEANRVMEDFAWANPNSEQFNKELSTEAAQLLQANLIIDTNTSQVIGSNISPYQLYKTLNSAAGISAVQGKIEGQKATETMLANTDTASSAAPPKKAENPLTKLWEDPL